MSDARHHSAHTFPFKPESWMDDAACVGYDPAWWYAERGGQNRSPESGATLAARAICAACPVRLKCLDYVMKAEANWSRYGIWAGLWPEERRKLAEAAS